jgi:hypothetical protein
MRIPRRVEQLLKEGSSLSAEAAEALERGLAERPDDVDARTRLIGYYEERRRTAYRQAALGEQVSLMRDGSPDDANRGRHALWLAANAPGAPVMGHAPVHFRMIDPAYAELSAVWRRHAAAEPPDATVLAHAIAFFWWENTAFADELVARAEQAFPGDGRWARFRRARRAHELSGEIRLRGLRVHGLAPAAADGGDDDDGGDRRAADARILDEAERLLLEDPDLEWGPRLREKAAELALGLGRLDRARAHAEQLLVSDVGDNASEHSDAAHDGHLLLGRIALATGDVERAKAHLILAGRAGATGLVPIFGPDMRLAADLLARGERDVVIRYLSHCRRFWQRGPVDAWIAELRAGGTPRFRGNLGE